MTPDRRAALMRDMPIDFAWGGAGLADLHGRCDVFVVLDVLCFTTSVDVAVARGAEVLPFPIGKYGADVLARADGAILAKRSEEHTSELQSLMRTSYAVFCWKKQTITAATS